MFKILFKKDYDILVHHLELQNKKIELLATKIDKLEDEMHPKYFNNNKEMK